MEHAVAATSWRARSAPGLEQARRRLTARPAGVVGLALIIAWLALDPRSPDLAAQAYRVQLFARQGFTLWDNFWFAGHHLPAYSLTFPPLATLFGMHLVGAAAAVTSALIFQRLVLERFGPRAPLRAAGVGVGARG